MLRAPELEDADKIFQWENDPDRLLHGRSGLPYSKALIVDFIRNYNNSALNDGMLRFVICTPENDAVGMVDLYDLDFSARKAFVSIYVDPEMRKRSVGCESIKELSDFARNHLGLNMLVAVVAANNIASNKLFDKAGFRTVAELPDWVRRPDGSVGTAELMVKSL